MNEKVDKCLRILEQYQEYIVYDDCGWVDLPKTLENALHRAKTYEKIVDGIEEIIVANPAIIVNTKEDEHVIDDVASVAYAVRTCNELCKGLEHADIINNMLREKLLEYERGNYANK